MLVFLPTVKETYRVLALDDSVKEFPLGSYRVISLSRLPVKLTLEDKTYEFKPGQSSLITDPPVQANHHSAMYAFAEVDGKWQRIGLGLWPKPGLKRSGNCFLTILKACRSNSAAFSTSHRRLPQSLLPQPAPKRHESTLYSRRFPCPPAFIRHRGHSAGAGPESRDAGPQPGLPTGFSVELHGHDPSGLETAGLIEIKSFLNNEGNLLKYKDTTVSFTRRTNPTSATNIEEVIGRVESPTDTKSCILGACRTWKAQDADDANADERLCCGGQPPSYQIDCADPIAFRNS